MSSTEPNFTDRILRTMSVSGSEDFDRLALDLFADQFENIPIYQAFCRRRGITPTSVKRIHDIPFFPTLGFRYGRIASFPPEATIATFRTTGTTDEKRGSHEYSAFNLYEEASLRSFETLTPVRAAGIALLSLVPATQEKPDSSLAYMVSRLGERCFSTSVSAFQDGCIDLKAAEQACRKAVEQNRPLFIASTTTALADWLAHLQQNNRTLKLLAGSQIFETGGRKGKRNLPNEKDLAQLAYEFLSISEENFLGEYGMTELTSSAWGRPRSGRMIYRFPSWCPVFVLDPGTLQPVTKGEEGMIAVFDSANHGSVSAILTGDWGLANAEGFEILGRASESELRGCSLLVSSSPTASLNRRKDQAGLGTLKTTLRSSSELPFERTLLSLSELTARWSSADLPERRSFEKEFQLQSGWAPGGITEGLNRTFDALRSPLLRDAAEETWPGGRPWRSGRLAVQVYAGNLPVTGVFGFYASLLAGIPAIHRVSSRGGNLLACLHKSLRNIDHQLAQQAAVVETASDDDSETEFLFSQATLIAAQGSDATLDRLKKWVPPGVPFVEYGPRLSFGIVPAEIDLSDEESAAFVEDIFIWEQMGCRSPQLLFFLDPSPARLATAVDRLQTAAGKLAKRWRRNAIPRNLGQVVWRQLENEFDPVDVNRFHMHPQLTAAVMKRPEPRWFSTPGFLQLIGVKTFGEVRSFLKPFSKMLGSCALPHSAFNTSTFRDVRERLSVEEVSPFGRLQSPPFTWRQNGHDRLRSLQP